MMTAACGKKEEEMTSNNTPWYIKNNLVSKEQKIGSILLTYSAISTDKEEHLLTEEIEETGIVSKEISDEESIRKIMNYIDSMECVKEEAYSPLNEVMGNTSGEFDVTIFYGDGSKLLLTTSHVLGSDGREAVAHSADKSYFVKGKEEGLKILLKAFFMK